MIGTNFLQSYMQIFDALEDRVGKAVLSRKEPLWKNAL